MASRITLHCQLINVHCYSPDAPDRWERRMRSGQLCGEGRLAKLEPLVRQLQLDLAEPLDFGCPTIVVSTLNGCRPTVNDIAATINESSGYPATHELDKEARPSGKETS